jgi:hypothetical protein
MEHPNATAAAVSIKHAYLPSISCALIRKLISRRPCVQSETLLGFQVSPLCRGEHSVVSALLPPNVRSDSVSKYTIELSGPSPTVRNLMQKCGSVSVNLEGNAPIRACLHIVYRVY